MATKEAEEATARTDRHVPFVSVTLPLPYTDDHEFTYVLKWDRSKKDMPSPLNFARGVAIDFQLDEVDVLTMACQIEEQLEDFDRNPQDKRWIRRSQMYENRRCLTKGRLGRALERLRSLDKRSSERRGETKEDVLSSKKTEATRPSPKSPAKRCTKKRRRDDEGDASKISDPAETKRKQSRRTNTKRSALIVIDPDKIKDLYDASMSYCGKCQLGGSIFCCSGCAGVYHAECVGLNAVPDGDWFCNWCTTAQKNLDACFSCWTDKSVEDRCRDLIDIVRKHDYANLFEDPVDLPNYALYIEKPMCLRDLETHLRTGKYGGDVWHGFITDFKLIWSNCRLFNQPKTGIWRVADDLGKLISNVDERQRAMGNGGKALT